MENWGLQILMKRERERERERESWISINCRFGDRILSVNSRDFTSIARREATEMLRSCDQLSVTLEISRITSHVKPLPQVYKSLLSDNYTITCHT
jgi:hypothetical protein